VADPIMIILVLCGRHHVR